jgi:hypothetical protein
MLRSSSASSAPTSVAAWESSGNRSAISPSVAVSAKRAVRLADVLTAFESPNAS